MNTPKKLRVFLCHASSDKYRVEILYSQLCQEGIDAWYDNEKLLPGQDWRLEIPKAVRNSHVVIVCVSHQSITKEGYVQKEIKIALDAADEKPDGTIFIIPTRLEVCDVPERLSSYQWVDLFSEKGYQRLFTALQARAKSLGITLNHNKAIEEENIQQAKLFFEKGKEYFQKRDYDNAIEMFSSSIKLNPRHVGAWTMRGDSYMRSKSNEENLNRAVEDFTMSLSLDSSGFAIHRLRGMVYLYLQQPDKAISDLKVEIDILNDADGYLYLGWAYHLKNDLDGALNYYRKSIEIDLQHAFSYLHMAWALVDKGDEYQAADNYKKALSLNPKFANSRSFNYLYLLKRNKLWDKFLEKYSKRFFENN